VWTVFVAFVAAFLVGSFGAGMVAVILAVAIHGPELLQDMPRFQSVLLQPPIFLPMLFATQVIIAAVALAGAMLSPVPLRGRLRLGRALLPWYGYAILTVGTVALGLASGIVIDLLGFGQRGVLEEFGRAMAGLRGPMLLLAAAVIGLSPGFGEELLFRGYIQTRLRQRWPRLLALAVASALFGFIHFDLVQSTFAVLLGLWLGEVADRTGSIWPCIVGHAVNNALATVVGALTGGGEAGAAGTPYVALAVTTAVFVVCLVYLLRRPVVEPEPVPQPEPLLPAPPAYDAAPPLAPG
jgi:membrane protease YdiL (CAAX protease family)